MLAGPRMVLSSTLSGSNSARTRKRLEPANEILPPGHIHEVKGLPPCIAPPTWRLSARLSSRSSAAVSAPAPRVLSRVTSSPMLSSSARVNVTPVAPAPVCSHGIGAPWRTNELWGWARGPAAG